MSKRIFVIFRSQSLELFFNVLLLPACTSLMKNETNSEAHSSAYSLVLCRFSLNCPNMGGVVPWTWLLKRGSGQVGRCYDINWADLRAQSLTEPFAFLVSVVGPAVCWVPILGIRPTSFLEVLGGSTSIGEQSKTKLDKKPLFHSLL